MKENKYDDEVFFEQYSQMPRSLGGLAAAGEWRALQKLLPNFAGKRVLDLGCGYGWHCAYAAEHGASYVLGTDISRRMLAQAAKRTAPKVEYALVAMEDFPFEPDSFDVVLSSLAFHYVKDLGLLFENIHRCLSTGGRFVFSMEHPVFTAAGPQQWAADEAGNNLCWPVDRYFSEGPRQAVFLGEEVLKYHHTLGTILGGVLGAGFSLKAIVEPQPTEEMLASVPEMADELRRPMMLLVAAEK